MIFYYKETVLLDLTPAKTALRITFPANLTKWYALPIERIVCFHDSISYSTYFSL